MNIAAKKIHLTLGLVVANYRLSPLTILTALNFRKFYLNTLMETGADILYAWVARMIMLGLYVTNKVPFNNVHLQVLN